MTGKQKEEPHAKPRSREEEGKEVEPPRTLRTPRAWCLVLGAKRQCEEFEWALRARKAKSILVSLVVQSVLLRVFAASRESFYYARGVLA